MDGKGTPEAGELGAVLDRLELAARVTDRVIAGVGEDQWGLPTPCAEWNVADVVDHLATGNERFIQAVGGAPPGGRTAGGGGEGQHGAALVRRYRESVRSLLDAAGRPGALDGPVRTPLGSVPAPVALYLRTADLLVHGWDLARATGQDVGAPAAPGAPGAPAAPGAVDEVDELAEHLLAFSRARLPDVPPERRSFGPSRPVAAGAPAIDRLVALLGREVAVPT